MSLAGSRLPSRWLVASAILGIAVLLTLLAATGFLGTRYWHEQQAASRRVEHSQRVIDGVERVRASLADLETETRGYLLTPDLTYGKPYSAAEDRVRRAIEALQSVVADDPLQSLRAAHLALIVAARLNRIDQIAETARKSGLEAALTMLQNTGEIQSQIDQMVDNERFLLAELQPRVQFLQQSTIWLVSVAVLAAIVFAAAALALAWLEVTQRRKAETKIRRLVDANIIGILISNVVEGRIIDANDAFLEMVGYSREDLVSGRMGWLAMTPTDWHAVSQQAIAELKATGSCKPFEKEYFRKDGSRVPVLLGAVSFEGSPDESVAFVLDLTERKQAEARQQLLLNERNRAEYLTGQVFESSPDGVSIIGRDYRLQRVNPAFRRRWLAERTVGMHLADLLGREFFEQTAKPQLDRCFAGEEVSVALWFTQPSGRRYLMATYTPLRPESERVEAALVITRDLTDHVLASEALRKAQAELAHVNRVITMEQLTGSIAHEIKQPIAASVTNALAAARWLAAQPPDLEEIRQALGRIVKDGNRASDVISRIRGLIKKVPPRSDPLDINAIILEVIALTRSEMLRNGVSLQTQLAERLPPVEGDQIQLQQVFLNLIINAVEAMSGVDESARELVIGTAEDSSNCVLVEVRDSGPGLNPESLDRVFEAFYTTKSGGMGMGLSICRSIIEAHGGRVWATPNVPQGAIFHLTLPPHRDEIVRAKPGRSDSRARAT